MRLSRSLLDQITASLSSFIAAGAYDQDSVYADVADRHLGAAVIVPPRITAVLTATADTAPIQRDHHLECIAEQGRAGRQKASGYTTRAKVKAAIERWKQVIGDGLRSGMDERRATEVGVAVRALNRMLALGRPGYLRHCLIPRRGRGAAPSPLIRAPRCFASTLSGPVRYLI